MELLSPASCRPAPFSKAVFAFVAGAAVLGLGRPDAAARSAPGDAPDEVAVGQPRVALPGSPETPFPHPLEAAEAARVKRIFDLQARRDWPAAIAESSALTSDLLLGALLADRYRLDPDAATPDRLRDWLAAFADQPDAPVIAAMLGGAEGGAAGIGNGPVGADAGSIATAPPRPGAARRLFATNRDAALLREAGALFSRRTDAVTGARLFVTGLAAWRAGQVAAARSCFDQAADATGAAPAEVAAASYWAGRAAERMRDPPTALAYLRRAAAVPRSFYGQIARRALGRRFDASADVAALADIEFVATLPAGRRAFALLQVDQLARARAELIALADALLARDDDAGARAVAAVAAAAGLDASAEAAWGAPPAEPRLLHASLPRLAPRGGFRVDSSLVYAVARTESNFDAAVTSASGARGMMQLMPVTAGVMAGQRRDGDVARLHDPAVNLDLGQRYLLFLGGQTGIGDDLVRVLASYNSGVGGYLRWEGAVRDDGDPLLFIEAIPVDETRAFVQRVLTWSWLYAAHLREPTDSLTELAAGRFPTLTRAVR